MSKNALTAVEPAPQAIACPHRLPFTFHRTMAEVMADEARIRAAILETMGATE